MQLIPSMLSNSIASFPKKDAIVFNDFSLTYSELGRQINRLANSLLSLGIRKGDMVMIHLANGVDIVTVYYALSKIGGVVVPLNVMYIEHEIEYIGNDTNAKAYIGDFKFYDVIKTITHNMTSLEHVIIVNGSVENTVSYSELLQSGVEQDIKQDIASNDIASIIYTSGTTGRPKGATQTHRSIMSNVTSCYTFNKFSYEDRFLCALPLFNNFAINVVMMSAFYSGATLILIDRFDAEKVLLAIDKNQATYFAGTPTMFVYLLGAYDPDKYDVSSLRAVNSGGAHCPAKLIGDFEREFGVVFLNGYGQTEGCGFTTLNPIVGVRKRDSVGVPISNITIKILDDDLNELPPKEVGEIVEKGDVFSPHGYWRKPEVNREAYRNGYFHSGDLGYVDEDGYLYVVDRKQDLIITGGANIYPVEVEEAIYSHPCVSMAAVVGVPDVVKGELAKAYIVLKEGTKISEKELIEHVRGKIAKYKAPRLVEFVDSLPQGPTGKILKKNIRKQAPK